MIKKLLLSSAIIFTAILTVSCSSKKSDLGEVSVAQTNLSELNSGHIMVSASVKTDDKQDKSITDFTYLQNGSGIYEYCQAQQDSNNKLVYCEVSDGQKAEQWLIGKGWSVMEPPAYSQENKHRFIGLITNEIDEKCVKTVTKVQEEENTHYEIEFDAEKLNTTIYKDTSVEIITQNISFVIDKEGQLISYTDIADILNKDINSSSLYSLEAQISEHNAINEVTKPEIRANADVEQEIENPEEVIGK